MIGGGNAAVDPTAAESRLKTPAGRSSRSRRPSTSPWAISRPARSCWADAQAGLFQRRRGRWRQPDYLMNLAVSLDHLRQPCLAAQHYRLALEAAEKRPRLRAGAHQAPAGASSPSHERAHAAAPPLGQILIAEGILSEDQARIALLEQMKSNQPIGKLLVSLGFVSEATLREALSGEPGQARASTSSHAVVDPQALKLVPREVAKRHHLLPLDFDGANHRLTLAVAGHQRYRGPRPVRSIIPDGVGSTPCSPANRKSTAPSTSTTATNFPSTASCTRSKPARSTGKPRRHRQRIQPAGGRLIDSILTDAVKRRLPTSTSSRKPTSCASATGSTGMLRQIRAPAQILLAGHDGAHQGTLGMNIAEMRAPRTDASAFPSRGRQVDFRVACQPTIHGENIVPASSTGRRASFPWKAWGSPTSTCSS